MSADQRPAVRVHSVQEEYFYLMVHPCGCGGAWLGGEQTVRESSGRAIHAVSARCARCGKEQFFEFQLECAVGPKGPVREVNPTAEPSLAIDVAEWMDLAQFYLGRIGRLSKPVEKAQSLLDARQCLEEALKFYGPGDDGPPPSALWSVASREKARRRPDLFRRTTIQSMLDRMPPLRELRKADSMDQKALWKGVQALARRRVGRRWWQFWKLFDSP